MPPKTELEIERSIEREVDFWQETKQREAEQMILIEEEENG
jgi:hypothetical protein